MTLLKDRLIADIADDSGADTLRRFFAQIEYTAFWCIRMLQPTEGIDAVVPETFDDVLVVRPDRYELRQVKARDESAGPWTVAEIHPVLVKQYARSQQLDRRCTFHFASNLLADTRTGFTKGGMGALYDLKSLLEAIHLGSTLSPSEKDHLDQFKAALVPRLEADLRPADGGQSPDRAAVEALLLDTYIETDCLYVAYPNTTYAYCNNNLEELDDALTLLYPGGSQLSLQSLRQMYEQVLHLIYERIRTGTSMESRRIAAKDVLQCRVVRIPEDGLIQEIASAPGKTLLDKKASLGGFDPTRRQNMYRQRAAAGVVRRKLRPDDNPKWEVFKTALLDRQISCLEAICGEKDRTDRPGPRILEILRPYLPLLAKEHFPDRTDVTDQVCLGVLWDETDECRALWHRPVLGGGEGMNLRQSDENMAYRAARVLLLISHCGKPRGAAPGVTGRTLLAKLDFFLRYPAFLERAAKALNHDVSPKDLGIESPGELTSVESHMVRYRYGPWDHTYYVILAYLIGKGLVEVDLKHRTETFRLTNVGREMTDRIGNDPAFADLAERADLVHALFGRWGGTRLKDFIYATFPEVVNRDLGAAI